MRDEVVIDSPGNRSTVREKWKKRGGGHWYSGAEEFALEGLGEGRGRSCLVIGSPLFELETIRKLGWETTYLDVRVPPLVQGRFVRGDATGILLPDESFEAVSSTCVVCHAGLGRYGDKEDLEHGDEKMLSEVHRVLKDGGVGVLMLGPVVKMGKMVRCGREHRLYTLAEAHRMILSAGFTIESEGIWSSKDRCWRKTLEPSEDLYYLDYLSMKVKKHALQNA